MSTQSGAFGLIGGRTTVSNWQLNLPMPVSGRAFSNTRGGMLRRPAVRSGTGSFSAAGASLQVFPGDTFEFVGFVGPETAYVPGATGPVYTCTAMVQSVTYTVNFSTQEIIAYTVNFQAVGVVTETTGEYSDLTYPDAPSASAGRVAVVGVDGSDSDSLAGSGEEVELCVETLTLTLTASNVAYSNSCTGGWQQVKPGNIDWNVSMVVHEASLNAMPYAAGDFVHLRIYVDDVRYWDLKWGIAHDFTNFTVDRETVAIVSWTSVLSMTSHTLDVADGIGHIRVPGHPTEDWWPKGEVGLELILNNSFDDGSDNWTQEPGAGTVTFAGGNATFAANGGITQQIWLEAGKVYKHEFTASAVSADGTRMYLTLPSTASALLASLDTPGTDIDDYTAVETGWHTILLYTSPGVTATLTRVSLKAYN